MLLRQTLLYLPAQVVGPIFQFISVVAWTHFLSPESMGIFALVTATQELAYTATLFWFTLYTMRYHDAAGPAEARRRFLDSEMAVMLASALASIVLVLGLQTAVEAAWSWSLLIAGSAYITTRAVVIQLGDRARTEHDTLTYSLLQMVWPVIGLALGLAFVKLFGSTAAVVLWRVRPPCLERCPRPMSCRLRGSPSATRLSPSSPLPPNARPSFWPRR